MADELSATYESRKNRVFRSVIHQFCLIEVNLRRGFTKESIFGRIITVGKRASQPIQPQQQNNCDPAYPDFCIPKNSPDLDCPDVTQRRFRVLPPDPHGFDRDEDGIGCEW